MSWTDERVTLLKKLWGEGRTAAEIAKALGGVTRNAVIGKAHRLKLSNRVSPIQQNKKPVSSSNGNSKTEPRKPVVAVVRKSGQGVALVDLKPSMCRWPFGDPKEENFSFCGEGIVAGFPYCAEHAKMAYQSSSRQRVLQAEEFEEKAESSDAQEHNARTAVGE